MFSGDLNVSEEPCEKGTLERPRVLFGYEDPEKNLLKNWSFDEPITPDDWRVCNATATRSPDAHTGRYSLHVHSRLQRLGQAYQRLYNLKPNTNYYLSFFLKFLSMPSDRLYFGVRIFCIVKFPDGARNQRIRVCFLTFQRAPAVWQQLGGNFKTPDTPFLYIDTHMELEPPGVDFLLDTSSLIELPPEPDWREHCEQMIDKYRRSDVSLRVKLPKDVDPKDVEIKVTQTKREFAIGSAIAADAFNSPCNENYRECFFKHFEWAVFCNDTKWKPMEMKRGCIRFTRVDNAIEKLHARGVTVRGHSVHWNNKPNCPVFIQDLTGDELQREIDRRTDYLVNHFKGRIVQWDVLNETLHNHFYEEATGNLDQIERMFHRIHQIDPDCHLYLNDYLVFRDGGLTSGQMNLAKNLLDAGIPVHGIGVQSHLRDPNIPFEILKKRVEIVSSVGLPVMVTELSVHSDDVSVRAASLERAMLLYFSQPAVAGIIFWMFSDQKGTLFCEDMVLFEGPNYEPNEAGKVLQTLLEKWRTKLTFRPSGGTLKESFRAYHGQYELEVLHKGRPVWGQSFKVEKGKRLTLDVDVELGPDSGSGDETGDKPSGRPFGRPKERCCAMPAVCAEGFGCMTLENRHENDDDSDGDDSGQEQDRPRNKNGREKNGRQNRNGRNHKKGERNGRRQVYKLN